MQYYDETSRPYVPDPGLARQAVKLGWEYEDVNFQLVDIKQFRTQPIPGMPGPQVSQVRDVTAIRIFGCTKEGNSVMCVVHGFEPYFWIQAPPDFNASHCEPFRAMLNRRAEISCQCSEPVTSISIASRMTLLNYQNDTPANFIRVTTLMPGFVPKVRGILEGKGTHGGGGVEFPILFTGAYQFMTYESNVLFELRFMVDTKIGGANWITCPAGSYRAVERKTSNSQIEINIAFDKLVAHDAAGEYMQVAPLRVLSFDIECEGRPGKFPEAQLDPVIQIAVSGRILGSSASFFDVVFCLKKTAPIPGVDVICFEKEKDLLIAFKEFYKVIDADMVTGMDLERTVFHILLLVDEVRET